MADDKFKLPSSSYEEITKIIKAYGHFSNPVGLLEVSKFIGMDPTSISRNTGFLIELGLLETGKKKVITSVGRELALALEHDMPEEIRGCLRKLVNENEFLSKLVAAIKIRNGMDEGTLQSHIAYSAGQPKSSKYMTGARTVIDILRASELVKESDGKIAVIKTSDQEENSDAETEVVRGRMAISERMLLPERPTVSMPVTTNVVEACTENTQVKININVTVDCSVEDLDGLGEKLNKIIRDVGSRVEESDDLAE